MRSRDFAFFKNFSELAVSDASVFSNRLSNIKSRAENLGERPEASLVHQHVCDASFCVGCVWVLDYWTNRCLIDCVQLQPRSAGFK